VELFALTPGLLLFLTPEFLPVRTTSELGTAPAVLLVDNNYGMLELLVGMLQQTYTIAAALSNGTAVTSKKLWIKSRRPELKEYSLGPKWDQ